MATRIDIELTSRQDEGKTFTWRAAGARQPKGAADASLFPEGSAVGDEFRVETEMGLDGIRVTSVVPSKEKAPKKTAETLDLISADDGPLVTQVLAEKGRRGDRGDRGDRKGGRKGGGRDRAGGDRGERGEGRRGGGPPRTPAKPKLPPKPKPPRLRAGKAHRNELIDSLPDEHKAIAQELLRGGLQSVRQGLQTQNEQRKAEGQDPIDEGPIVTLAEELLLKVRAAEWRDRAEAALEQAAEVDLRDLRTVVTAADGAAKDDETRAIAAKLRTALNERLDADQQAWVAEVVEMLDDDRVVRALHLSSRPPKAGAPLPAPVALRLVEAANASMSSETSPDRWGYILEALAHSPVRRQVVPVSLPTNVSPELKATIARHGSRLPEIAQIFGIEPDAKAGRSEGRRKPRGGGKKKGDGPKRDGQKKDGPKKDGPKNKAEGRTDAEKPATDQPAEAPAEPAEVPAEPAEVPAEEAATEESTEKPATAEPAEAPAEEPAAETATTESDDTATS